MPDKKLKPEESLTVKSSLLIFLRALYSLMLPCGVYVRDGFEPIFVTKEQLVTLVELGKSESPVSDLPTLIQSGLLRTGTTWTGIHSNQDKALVINVNGARVCTIQDILNPPAPVPPDWWDAPLPFAMCASTGPNASLKINSAAVRAFGVELERLRAADLPAKDEFIVELEGRGKPCFLTFRRLPSRPGEAVVFILDDCTGDLAEAQDISWWAGVGRSWVSALEANGGAWRREEKIPKGATMLGAVAKDKDDVAPENDDNLEAPDSNVNFLGLDGPVVLPCDWQGRFMGYLCIDDAESVSDGTKKKSGGTRKRTSKTRKSAAGTTKAKKKTTGTRKRKSSSPDLEASESDSEQATEPRGPLSLKEDTLIQELSPQTMALLSVGQDRELDLDSGLDSLDLKPRARGSRRKSGDLGGGDGLDQVM